MKTPIDVGSMMSLGSDDEHLPNHRSDVIMHQLSALQLHGEMTTHLLPVPVSGLLASSYGID